MIKLQSTLIYLVEIWSSYSKHDLFNTKIGQKWSSYSQNLTNLCTKNEQNKTFSRSYSDVVEKLVC